MKRTVRVLPWALTAVALLGSGAALAAKSNETKAREACEWYKKHYGQECKVDKGSCPMGWRAYKSFEGNGPKYSACIPKAAQKDLAKADAEKYCAKYKADNPGRDCFVKQWCGIGLAEAKVFQSPWGTVRACVTKDTKSDMNKQNAEKRCETERSKGNRCEVHVRLCPIGWTAVAKFQGRGTNYSACVRTDRGKSSDNNKRLAEQACADYIKNNPKRQCIVDKRACPVGWTVLRRFAGKGTNYSACVTKRR